LSLVPMSPSTLSKMCLWTSPSNDYYPFRLLYLARFLPMKRSKSVDFTGYWQRHVQGA
jgi:hypothetical protein